jgi:3',5'-cyclic AMP phosphodiesterase CpdA
MGVRWFRKKHAFNPEPAPPVVINDRARVLLVGDWGTGLPRAQKVAREMRQILDEGNARGIQQHVIHLGDVYYSGWKREYEKRFLPYWPVKPSEADLITSWSANANHDMYAGGYGYFDFLLKDPRFKRQAGRSFFSLNNSHWTLLGLDTAYDDHDLKEPQGQWVRDVVNHTTNKMMLLSHHQPFSAYENGKKNGGKKLLEKLKPVLESGRINTWFWGHEHRCVTYKPHCGVTHGRCIGHGGVPVYMWRDDDDEVKEPADYEYRGKIQDGLEPWALFGFSVLDFDGPRIKVRYIDENGNEHKTEEIQ